MSDAALVMRDVRVARGRRDVLAVPSLTVAAGETVGVLGPNGAGKTTLLLVGALLLAVREGSVELFGERARGDAEATRLRRRTATVFQDPGLLDMSAQRNVETALALHGVPRGERRARADEWLGRLGVRHLAKARPHTLSGGEAQRVSIARAFAVRPELIFLDEPFTALDPGSRAQLVGDLRTLLEAERTAALLTTHDLSEAHLLAGRAVVLLDGRVAQLGAVDDVFARPASDAVAAFLGFNVCDAALLRRVLELPAAGVGTAYVPPAAACLAIEGARAAVPGSVVAVLGALGQGRLVVDIGTTLTIEVPVERIRAERLRAGSAVWVSVDPNRVVWPTRAGE